MPYLPGTYRQSDGRIQEMIEFYNDFGQLGQYMIILGYGLLILICSMVWHELGHMIYFLVGLKKSVNMYPYFEKISHFGFRLGKESDYQEINGAQYNRLLLSGIFLGFVPIVLIAALNTTINWGWMAFPYIAGSYHDLKLVFDNKNEE